MCRFTPKWTPKWTPTPTPACTPPHTYTCAYTYISDYIYAEHLMIPVSASVSNSSARGISLSLLLPFFLSFLIQPLTYTSLFCGKGQTDFKVYRDPAQC